MIHDVSTAICLKTRSKRDSSLYFRCVAFKLGHAIPNRHLVVMRVLNYIDTNMGKYTEILDVRLLFHCIYMIYF